MATASMLKWVPDSLYNLAVSVTVCNYHAHRAEVKTLPDSVHFDVLYKVWQPYCHRRLWTGNVQRVCNATYQRFLNIF